MQISESRLTRVVKRFVNIEQDKVNILCRQWICNLLREIVIIYLYIMNVI